MRIIINQNIANTLMKKRVKEMTVLFASYQIDQVKQCFAEDIEWTLVGDKPIIGKENFVNELMRMSGNKASELTINNIITDRKKAAISGEMKMEDGNIFGFSDFYEFASAESSEVKSITSYMIKINSD